MIERQNDGLHLESTEYVFLLSAFVAYIHVGTRSVSTSTFLSTQSSDTSGWWITIPGIFLYEIVKHQHESAIPHWFWHPPRTIDTIDLEQMTPPGVDAKTGAPTERFCCDECLDYLGKSNCQL